MCACLPTKSLESGRRRCSALCRSTLAVQKGVHFYVTYVLAKKVGLPAQDPEKLA
jgi:hypothetical protein